MAIQTWAPGTLYEPGALAQPRTTPAPGTVALQNPGAETGGIGGWTITRVGDPTGSAATPTAATDRKYVGNYAFRWQGASGGGHAGGIEGIWINNARGPVRAGQVVSGSAMIAFDDTSQSQNQAEARIYWFDSSGAVLSYVSGTLIRGNNSNWRMSTVSATAPANAATCSFAVWTTANYSGGVRFDDAKWDYSYAADSALVYKAVQATSGYSNNVEPAWPSILGQQVVDNEVTWEAVYANQVVWQASPILMSGATEPNWPTSVGAYVADGTINWKCTSRRVEDANCPNSKFVVIAASKVYAGDDDIVRYSATVNPLDWTKANDAGYLPTGLQNYGANPVAAMGLYRGNLIPFNAEAFQLWQIDEDPASMALLDALPMGSTQHHSIAPVSNDLFFLASQGVRTVGIAASSTNFQAGDVGMPVDPLVQEAMQADDAPIGLYYPAAGQYWLIFNLDVRLTAPDIRGVTLIPSTGSFAYSTTKHTRMVSGQPAVVENQHTTTGKADVVVALEQLFEAHPGCDTVSLVVSWFGDDLRAGQCQIKPRLAVAPPAQSSVTWSPSNWKVGDVTASTATLVTFVNDSGGGHSVYGSTPSDDSIVEVIQYLREQGKRIVFYPFVLMDIPSGNTLPNPYGGSGQPVNPWRGRVTCYPAPGQSGTPDGTSAAGTQIDTFFTRQWGFENFIAHYRDLCASAGGVDVFLIGSEMVGITQVRSSATVYPAIAHLRTIAAGVKAAMPTALVSYAADWTEYHTRQYSDGTLNFHMDPLWSDPNIDFVGIDNYFPIADVRDIDDASLIYDVDYLKSNIEAGELFDWYYQDRTNNIKAPITDGAYNKPWVYRQKDIRSWWSNVHVPRAAGVETTATAWVPGSKPIWFTEYGCPAVNRGPNQPNVFYDPNSSESTFPYFSTGVRDDRAQWAYYKATIDYWAENGGDMLSIDNMIAWTWDARPYPQFPVLTAEWGDYGNYPRGHWLQGREPVALQAEAFVYSMTRIGQVGAWSRYVFPFTVEDWAIKGDDLYLRSGDSVHRYDINLVGDEVRPGVVRNFEGMIQWPWLDFGQPAVTKALYGFDIVGTGEVTVEFGYDQTNGGAFTDPYKVVADTVPGPVIPMPLAAPSLAVRLTYDGSVQWQFNAINVYLQDMRGMS
ncbi:glycoside hydrolase TIM-barrel-like domain-containing protein [Xanthomonas sacchari]|uniref:baseplate megatron protein TIM-barrel domain-containing protein n=1 Tax=Xanthomonas sacchari TaxID=56458 RepID=UPI002253D490|nr:glycoside hydrolase TIM-barrel-like domain-containing protein [Xanthomonas sacchari]UYK67820.1 glycoside hydrolase TIM-barrel-like domain-containing protein [Xanthomonas sacchari]